MKTIKRKRVAISDIQPAPYNPRSIDERALQGLRASIDRFGLVEPIVVNERNMTIVGGHQRLKALQDLGETKVEVTLVDLTPQEERALNLTLNNQAIQGEWTPDLKDLLAELEQEFPEFGILQLDSLFDDIPPFDVQTLEDDIEDIPRPSVKPVTRRGDVIILGDHRLMCGDCTRPEDVMRLMHGERADMIFTDPPYAVSIGKKNRDLQSIGIAVSNTDDIQGDDLPIEEIAEQLWKPAFTLMAEQLKNKGAYYVTAPQGGDQMMMMMKGSMPCRHELIWIKNAPTFSMGRLDYSYQHEPILYGWKGKNHNFYATEPERSIWNINRPTKSNLHPTMKPVELVARAIQNSSRPGDIVLDPFGGSGTTLIACERLNRKCRIMEIDPAYCDIILARYKALTGQTPQKERTP